VSGLSNVRSLIESHEFTPPAEEIARVPTCRDMSELVTDYLEQSTQPGLRASMWWHLLRCEACRRYYNQVRQTVRLLGQGPRLEPDNSVEDAVVTAAQAAQRPED